MFSTGKKIWFGVALLFVAATIVVWDGLYRRSTGHQGAGHPGAGAGRPGAGRPGAGRPGAGNPGADRSPPVGAVSTAGEVNPEAGLTVFENGGELPAEDPRAARPPAARPARRSPDPARAQIPREPARRTPPEVPPEKHPAGRTWTVEKGQSLYGIAEQCYGDSSRWREIARLNGIEEPYLIRPGQVLRVPR